MDWLTAMIEVPIWLLIALVIGGVPGFLFAIFMAMNAP